MMVSNVSPRRKFRAGALVLGAAATVVFYAVAHLPAFAESLITRYTTGHWVEYVTMGLFLWAMADLLLKVLGLRSQRSAMRHEWLPAYAGPQPVASSTELLARVESAPATLAESYIGRRFKAALYYVRERRSADRLEQHLRYLADLDADQSHGSFALVRVLAWMIPIMGFLGTVIGITLAIANVTPSQLETSLNEVTGGLAVAFDTTALSLTLSMVLIVATFFVERAEQAILGQVESTCDEALAHRFRAEDPANAPYLHAVQAASETVIQATSELVQRQAEIWSRSIGVLLEQQQQANALMQQSYQQANSQQEERLAGLLEALAAQNKMQAEEMRRSVERLEKVERQVTREQSESLARSLERMERLERQVVTVAELLLENVNGQRQLVTSQQSLARNLELLQQTQGFDETLHSLTAAIHLLTIRQQPAALRKPEAA